MTMDATAPRVPQAAAWLGGLGLLPFMIGASLVITSDFAWAADGLRYYAATILAFMGGVHWGLAIGDFGTAKHMGANWPRLGASVLPSLIAWLALWLGGAAGLLMMAAAFVGLCLADVLASKRGLAPAWYPRLRIPLSAIVASCLMLAALV